MTTPTNYGQLFSLSTGEYIREATRQEAIDSSDAGDDGAIRVDGVTVYVEGGYARALQTASELGSACAGVRIEQSVDGEMMGKAECLGGDWDALREVVGDDDDLKDLAVAEFCDAMQEAYDAHNEAIEVSLRREAYDIGKRAGLAAEEARCADPDSGELKVEMSHDHWLELAEETCVDDQGLKFEIAEAAWLTGFRAGRDECDAAHRSE